MDVSMEVVKTPRFILKAVQLILAIVCSILNDYGLIGLSYDIHKIILVYVVLCGYILILLMDVSKIVSSGKTAKPVEIFWSFISGILWITAGALIIETYRKLDELSTIFPNIPGNNIPNVPGSILKNIPGKDQFIAAGIISLLNALAFFAEAAVIFKSG
ncbi:uncharacterized protein LOC124166098 [Ischnura elegans]|uniref:uncharacterized protein LOC124166098 n=1 Tax=Ischnura elegans TaxID=197161 RepID=UPI001ED88311|nr:uncharacterized protein LOC124166098 [Ischnura elegans]